MYGGARQVLLLLNGLAEQGVQSTLVVPPDSAIRTAVDESRVRVQPIPMSGELDARFGRRLHRWVASEQPDILHVHSRRGADIWGGLAARRARVPAILSRRVDSPELPVLGRIKYRLFDRVIAISKQIQHQLILDGVVADKIDLVQSSIDAQSCQPSWSREQFLQAFGFAADDLVVICVAQMIPRKGHEDLLAAWPDVLRENPQARLLLLGQGELEADLRQRAGHHDLRSTVQVAGFRADVREFLGLADVLVHPALHEGLGVVLLEAQAAGVPVVACDAGGVPEAVAADRSALLVPPGDGKALAAALTRMLVDPKLRAEFGAAGRQHVAQHFSVAEMVAAHLDIYQTLLSASGNGANS